MSLSSHLQGLYPQNENLGEYLTETQLKRSNPPVDVNNSRIEEEKNKLQNNALPHSMTFIPFQTKDIMSMNSCRRRVRASNTKSLSELSIENEFNEKYKVYIDRFNGRNNTGNYSFSSITSLCDSVVASYVDGRALTKLNNTGINIEGLYDSCIRALNISFGEESFVNNETSFIKGTYFMGLLVNYSKLKIEEDISGKNLSNSTNPKMIIVSGHDTTISNQVLFLISAFGKTMSFFRMPSFATQ